MAKYLFNSNIHGYETATAKDFDKEVGGEDTLIVIVDKTCQPDSSYYYKLIDKALRNQARVILISVDDNNELFCALASNMIVFKDYDIYQVVDKDSISADYLIKIQDRHPDITEAQTYLPNDIIAYQDICTLLYGIDSLVNEGNLDGLKNHVERYLTSIEGAVTAINKMKKTCEEFNSNELIDNITALKERINTLNNTISEKEQKIDDVKHSRDEYKVETENLKRELNKIKSLDEDTSTTSNDSRNVIKSYSAYNTSIHSNNKALVIYFKEVSYVKYTNTLVSILCEMIEKMKLNYKLLIYDNNTNMLSNYGLDVITGDAYAANKEIILKKKRIIVAEPFQSIIQDVVSSQNAVDVVVIYDRLRQYEDIIKGNNVTKFFVINSSKDVDKTIKVKSLGADDTSYIITNTDNSYGIKEGKQAKFLDIPNLNSGTELFSGLSDSAQFVRYRRLRTTKGDLPLIDTILKKSHIESKQ